MYIRIYTEEHQNYSISSIKANFFAAFIAQNIYEIVTRATNRWNIRMYDNRLKSINQVILGGICGRIKTKMEESFRIKQRQKTRENREFEMKLEGREKGSYTFYLQRNPIWVSSELSRSQFQYRYMQFKARLQREGVCVCESVCVS